MKTISKETAKRKLKRKVNQMFTKEEQKDLAFLPDREGKKTVTLLFTGKDRRYELICCLRQGIITTVSEPVEVRV